MSFNSLTYILFLGLAIGVYRLAPWKIGRLAMVVASYVFYGFANPAYCFLLVASTLIDFFVALGISKNESPLRRKALLAVSIVGNLGILLFFKYGDFFLENTGMLLSSTAFEPMGFALPLGISFYTFQTMSYTLDVYYGKTKPTGDLVGFSLYVAFFPQLIAGPIERAETLLPQLLRKQPLRAGDMEYGFQRILIGLVKKMVLADRLAVFVDHVFENPQQADGLSLLVASLAFVIQLYLDFSAYTDIAIGSARMMGITLRENFRWPLISRNPVDFWSRWHISLTTWFRDYLFTALIGRRRPSTTRKTFNLLLVMTLIGLWHGAGWNFVLFGFLAGAGLAGYEAVRKILRTAPGDRVLGNRTWSTPLAITLHGVLVLTLVVVFRSPTPAHAWHVIAGIFQNPWTWLPHQGLYIGLTASIWCGALAAGLLQKSVSKQTLWPPLKGAAWALLVVFISVGAVDVSRQFIYFQF